MSDNSTEILHSLQNAFTEFKSANDARLTEIEKKGSADVLLNEKVDRLNDALTELERKNARPKIETGAVEDAEYKSEFNSWARKGVEIKSVNVTTDADGGVLLPKTIEAGVYSQLQAISPIRALSNVVNVSSQSYSFLQKTSGSASGWVGEADARPETVGMKFASVTVPMGELYSNTFVTQRALDDVEFDLEAYVAEDVAIEMAKKEATAFLTGTGTNQPSGILTTTGLTTVNSKSASGLGVAHDFAINMVQAMAQPYRDGAAFFGSASSFAIVRTQKSGADGSYYWTPSTVVGQPSTLVGRATYECEDMPAIAANATPIMLANLKQGYTIADRKGFTVLRDPFSNKPHVSFYITKRLGGIVKDKLAFVLLKIAA